MARVDYLLASRRAFAAVTDSGHVLVWGDPAFGGDSTAAICALAGRRASTVVAGHHAFAAMLVDGGLAAWGDASAGGVVPERLATCSPSCVVATSRAFAAILPDGSIAACRNPGHEHRHHCLHAFRSCIRANERLAG